MQTTAIKPAVTCDALYRLNHDLHREAGISRRRGKYAEAAFLQGMAKVAFRLAEVKAWSDRLAAGV